MEVSQNIYFNKDEKMNKTSMFVRFLIKICFIPVTVKNDKIEFKILSCKTFVFFAYSILFNAIYQMSLQLLIGNDKLEKYVNEVRMFKTNVTHQENLDVWR